MKKISEHLGAIIAVLAGVALLISVCVGPASTGIKEFFGTTVDTYTAKSEDMLDSIGSREQPTMLEGNGATFYKAMPTSLTFRSSAELEDFKQLKINGTVVDSSNYTLSSGSTIVTLSGEYVSTLENGTHTLEIVSKSGAAKAAFRTVDASEIPQGGTYYRDGNNLSSMPNDVALGDLFTYGDYEYCYGYEYSTCGMWSNKCGCNTRYDGWNVRVINSSKTSYGQILEHINGQPVTSLSCAFRECEALTTAPKIPNTITNMYETFGFCRNLINVQEIPSSVTIMDYTFAYCENLVTPPDMSKATNVERMRGAFIQCAALTSAPRIPSTVTELMDIFFNCTSLTGTIELPCSYTAQEDLGYNDTTIYHVAGCNH